MPCFLILIFFAPSTTRIGYYLARLGFDVCASTKVPSNLSRLPCSATAYSTAWPAACRDFVRGSNQCLYVEKIALALGLSLDGLGHLVLPGPNSALETQDSTVGNA